MQHKIARAMWSQAVGLLPKLMTVPLFSAEVCDASRHACGNSLASLQAVPQARAQPHRRVYRLFEVQGTQIVPSCCVQCNACVCHKTQALCLLSSAAQRNAKNVWVVPPYVCKVRNIRGVLQVETAVMYVVVVKSHTMHASPATLWLACL